MSMTVHFCLHVFFFAVLPVTLQQTQYYKAEQVLSRKIGQV